METGVPKRYFASFGVKAKRLRNKSIIKEVIFKRKNKGFSLIEILISIIILSMLAITSYLVLPTQINKAYDARRKADLNRIKTNLESIYNDIGQYPKELPKCGDPLVFKGKILLPSVPCDPITEQPYYYQTKTGEPQSYRLYALLTNKLDESIAKVGCSGGCGNDCFYNYGVSSSNVGLIRCSFVCAPGGGKMGSCELYNDPTRSLCPKEYGKDSTCKNECSDSKNRCKNASGKNIPY